MKTKKSLALIGALALLATAPISVPFITNNSQTQTIQAASRHKTHIVYTRNWDTRYTWNKYTHRWNKLRLHTSPAWQKEFKKYEREDDIETGDVADKPYDYNSSNIIQEIKTYNEQSGSTLFPSINNSIYVESHDKKLINAVSKAAAMWEPEFHFIMTNNPTNANVTIEIQHIPAKEDCDADEGDSDDNPESHKIIRLDLKAMSEDDYDYKGAVFLIAHELGHAIGLPHDNNLDSVMADDDSEYEPTNAKELKHYQGYWVTDADKRVVEELYHENQ